MTETASKKLISFFAVLFICLAAIPLFVFDGFAADGVTMRLEKLEKDFPSGYYYNHRVNKKQDTVTSLLEDRNEGYWSSVTKYPCLDHDGKAQVGTYDCNYFDGGYQCHGFASMLFYEIFGVRQTAHGKIEKNTSQIKPGDLVRMDNDTHSAIVVSVKGDSFTVAECNIGDSQERNSCKIRWGRECNVSDIDYYIRAKNYDKVSADTNWKNVEDKKNFGSEFYAVIYNGKKVLTLSGKTAVFKAYKGTAAQVWKFTRQKNGSYKIESCKNGLVLEVEGAVKSGKANIKTAKFSGAKAQLWSFYKSGKSYYISADCGKSVLVASGDGSALVNKKTAASTRLFTLKKHSAPEASTIKAKASDGYVKLSWTKGKNTTDFDVKIYDASSKLRKQYQNQKGTSLEVKLSAGTYSARIISKNAYSETTGNTVYFTVGKKGELGQVAKVTSSPTLSSITLSWTPVPGADSYAIFQKTADGWKAVAVTEKTKHSFKKLSAGKKYLLAIKACKKSKDGKLTPSKKYIAFTVATKPKAVSKLTASQSTSAVALKWPELKNADGYRVYKKTSSGWEKLITTSEVNFTAKGLSAGQNYTFAVKPYIKTTLGVVWGELLSINTATKPAAPVVSVAGVKNLKATLRWDKVKGADGYQVYYKLAGQEEYTYLANYSSGEGGVELSKLTAGVKYTFAVRAYKTVNGKAVYGPYSEVSFIARFL